MLDVAEVVLPVFMLILLGWALRVSGFPGDAFWGAAERLCYYLLFPSLIALTIAKADFGSLTVAPMAGAIIISIVLMTVTLVGVQAWVRLDGAVFSSFYQGAVRMNTYIGLSIAGAARGDEGLAAAALAIGVIVPLVNVSCVTVLAIYAQHEAPSARSLARKLAANPLIIACAVGGALNVAGVGAPPLVAPLAELLARAALPIGLLTVGAALNLSAALRSGALALYASVLKLCALPLMTWAVASTLGVDEVSTLVAVLFNGLPTAPSAYVLAREMGGDSRLMAGLIAVETLLSAITLPVWLHLVG